MKTAQQYYMDGALAMIRQVRVQWDALCEHSPNADHRLKSEYAKLLEDMERDIAKVYPTEAKKDGP